MPPVCNGCKTPSLPIAASQMNVRWLRQNEAARSFVSVNRRPPYNILPVTMRGDKGVPSKGNALTIVKMLHD